MVTILDVARHSNVSKSTVSLVINNSDAVKDETRIKVLESIKALGYVPNMAARELQTKVKNILGMVFLVNESAQKAHSFNSVTETLFYDTFTGISSFLKDTDYGLLNERFSTSQDQEAMPSLIKNNRVDGVFIIGGLFSGDFIQHIQQRKIPAVLVGRHSSEIDSVAPDVTHAIDQGTKYLLSCGHQHIAFINGPKSMEVAKKKVQSFTHAMTAAGKENLAETVVFTDYTGTAGYDAMKEIWESGTRPDAVLAASDGIAVGAMRYLYDIKVRIPEDISVMSYEQSIISEHAIPALTTMDINKERMGEEASRLLLNRIKYPDRPIVSHTVETSLVIRDSVKVQKRYHS
ncbi:LacI family transcriptional regulator [Bacillaceae bacterium SIJ1]|uniref:LacI family DNA-binding transcriptional regulator n=1 Tax=Litoribacterium kuwaitense TaxID=1398745 RepID=UPI0013EC9025|nr:LacI family DNA-binding transcriptional regulator [Litoribacterium kuwaitense]NGP43829.1 LacI family transcriptional regulator [Litoribacterium kuwaitense]